MTYTLQECKEMASPLFLSGWDQLAYIIGMFVTVGAVLISVVVCALYFYYLVAAGYKWAKRQHNLPETEDAQ